MAMLAVFPPLVFRIRRNSKRGLRDRDLVCEASAGDMLTAARAQGLYEVGKRSGAWAKYRLNSGQELVIGGYIPGAHGVDAIVVGYYRGQDLIYVARVRNGFVPASRRQVFTRLKPLLISKCPFVNLPERHKGRWGEG